MSTSFQQQQRMTGSTTNSDPELVDPPPDSISCIAFSPVADYLAVGSWDYNVRLYEVDVEKGSLMSQGRALFNHEGPVLDVCWSKDGNKVFPGGADKAARMYDIAMGSAVQVGAHDSSVKCVRWYTGSGGVLITGSWDKTVKYWDTRSATPLGTVQVPERCVAMDVAVDLLVVATAEQHIILIDLRNPFTIVRKIESPLRMQTRSIGCFPTGDGFAVGSIEGRLGIQWVKDTTNNYSFKCHRKEVITNGRTSNGSDVYAINAVVFHQQHGTFGTGGSDGSVCTWDGGARVRLKTFDAAPGPISCMAFNRTGTVLAYAVSYDWSKGYTGMVAGHPNKVVLHMLKDEEIKRKAKR